MPLILPARKGKTKIKVASGSVRPLRYLADRIYNTPLLIAPSKLEAILAALGPRIGLQAAIRTDDIWPDDDDDDNDDMDSPADEEGIATLAIHGTLVRRSGFIDAASGIRSYEGIKAAFQKLLDDVQVKAIVLDVDSPGGEASGVDEVSDMIYAARGTKPIIAIANDSAYSAAYWIASAADRVMVTRMGGVGSIGVYALHADLSGWDEKTGVKYTYIYSGQRKVDGNPHEPLNDNAMQTLQEQVDNVRQMFVRSVARNRGVDAQKIYDTEAQIFMGGVGIDMLADQVGTLEDAHSIAKTLIKTARSRSMAHPESIDILCGPIAPHKTATSDKAWDGPANEARLKLNQSASYYRRAYAWQDPKGDETKKNSYRFIHHEVSGDGNIGAANIKACQTGIGVLNGGRGGTTIPASDKKGVYNHLSKHIRDAGLEPPDYKGESMEAEELNYIPAWVEELRTLNVSGMDFTKADGSIFALRRLGTVAFAGSAQDPKIVKITGILAPYNSLSCDMGGFREIYEPGCFTEWLKSEDDAQVLAFHNPEHVLGRRSNGTARFWEDAEGLHYEADMPETQPARDLRILIERGDVRESSAAFYIVQYRWEQRSGGRIRFIEKAKLVEGSPHSFAAYRDSSSAVMPEREDKAAAERNEIEMNGARLRISMM